MAYGSATVRPYVGAVKRVALPIVPQGINGIDAPHFHRPSPASLIDRRSFKWNALESMVVKRLLLSRPVCALPSFGFAGMVSASIVGIPVSVHGKPTDRSQQNPRSFLTAADWQAALPEAKDLG